MMMRKFKCVFIHEDGKRSGRRSSKENNSLSKRGTLHHDEETRRASISGTPASASRRHHRYLDSDTNQDSETESLKNKFRRHGSGVNLLQLAKKIGNKSTDGDISDSSMKSNSSKFKKSCSTDDVNSIPNNCVRHRLGQGLAKSSLSPDQRKKSKSEDIMVTLFEAIEVCNLDKVKDIMATKLVALQRTNQDEFTILDLATLLNFENMAAELSRSGARENQKFLMKEVRHQHICALLKQAETHSNNLSADILHNADLTKTFSHEHQQRFWEWRVRLLAKMKVCIELARIPDPPAAVNVVVTSPTSIKVSISPPKNCNGSIATRYKIIWSTRPDFERTEGEYILLDLRDLTFIIKGLSTNIPYYIRVAAANIKGFGCMQTSSPASVTPSTWRDVCNAPLRCTGRKATDLSLICEQLRMLCLGNYKTETGRKSRGAKFIKSLSQGVYLSAVLYTSDERVILTTDDLVPTVEVDEGCPSNISHDFHWFLKVSNIWEELNIFYQELDQNSTNSSIAFRARLLQAALNLQSLLCTQEIGQLYHRVLRDNHGNILFVLLTQINQPKIPSGSGTKLSSIAKAISKRRAKLENFSGLGHHSSGNESSQNSGIEEFSAMDMLFLDLEELVRFQQCQQKPVRTGLYLALLKAESSINNLNVQLPYSCPNMLPCVRIRDLNHVSRDEWSWLVDGRSTLGDLNQIQRAFRLQLAIAVGKLFRKMSLKDDQWSYRLYTHEIIEVNSDISVILLLPSIVTSVNSASDTQTTASLVSLQIHLFEFTHLSVYQRYLTSSYCRVACLLDILNLTSLFQLRQAFSDAEVKYANARVETISRLAEQTEIIWKSLRWVLDTLQITREQIRHPHALGVPLRFVLDSARGSLDYIGKSGAKEPNYLSGSMSTHCGLSQWQNSASGITMQVFPLFSCGLPHQTSVRVHVTPQTTSKDILEIVNNQLKEAALRHNPGLIWPPNDAFELCLTTSPSDSGLQANFRPFMVERAATGTLYIRLRKHSPIFTNYSEV